MKLYRNNFLIYKRMHFLQKQNPNNLCLDLYPVMYQTRSDIQASACFSIMCMYAHTTRYTSWYTYLICLFPQFSMLRSTNRVVTVVEFQAMHPKLDNILLQNTENRLPFFCFERFCQICKKNYAIILWGYLSNFRCPSCNVHDLPNLIQRPTSADQLSCNYAVLKVIT